MEDLTFSHPQKEEKLEKNQTKIYRLGRKEEGNIQIAKR